MFKSIKTGVLALILLSTAIIAHAQTKISEGVVVYTSEVAGAKSETKIKFSGDISNFEIQAGPALIVIYNDNVNHVGMVTVDVPVQQMQIAAKMTKADMEAEGAKYPKYEAFTATGEKQVIATYNAEKYTSKNDKGENVVLWVTNDLDIPANSITAPFKGVKGTPVQLISPAASFLIKSVKAQKIGPLSVTKVPSGYEEITYAEMKAMSGRQ